MCWLNHWPVWGQSGALREARQPDKLVSAGEPTVERTEGVREVAIAKTIGEAHLLDAAHIECVYKAGDPFRDEMCVIDSKRRLERA